MSDNLPKNDYTASEYRDWDSNSRSQIRTPSLLCYTSSSIKLSTNNNINNNGAQHQCPEKFSISLSLHVQSP